MFITGNHAVCQVRSFTGGDRQAWDDYVRRHPSGTAFHLQAWSRAVERSYAHRPCHMCAWRGESLVGVLPLFEVNSLLAGRVLVSVPYATYGGILADDPQASSALLDAATGLADERKARYIELRHRDPSSLDLPVIDRYVTFRMALPGSPQEVLPAMPKKCRAAVRSAVQQLGDDPAVFDTAQIDVIHGLYAHSLRRLGSPCYRRSLFRFLAEEYGKDCICTVIRHHGKPVAGVVSLAFRDELCAYFSGNAPDMPRNTNNLLYCRQMEWAAEHGFAIFDMNRTRRDNRGCMDFKRHLGIEPQPMHYQYHPPGRMPNLTPSNPAYALAGRVWRHMPLWLTRLAGARVTRWIP